MVGYVAPLPGNVYTFKHLHREQDENGTYILPMDAGWTQMRETERCSPVRGRMDTISESAVSRLVRITIETVDGCPFQWNSTPPWCNGCSFVPPEGGFEYIGVMLQRVDDTVAEHAAESRKLDIEGATQLRSIRSRLFVDGQEVLLGVNGALDQSDPLTTWTNTGLSPFFLEDGVPGPTGDQIVFHDPNNPSNQDYPGYRLIGTPGDVTVNPFDPGDPNYTGVVLHLYNFHHLAVDRIELDLIFDLESPGDLNADRVVDDVEYASLFASMPPADPGPTTGAGPSLFDGLEAQAVMLTTGGLSAPGEGDGTLAFLNDQPGQTRDEFYGSAAGFLNTVSLEFRDDLKLILEELDELEKLRRLEFEESWERIRFQVALVDGVPYLEIDFGDMEPTLKIRYDGDFTVEVWFDDIDNPVFLFEIDGELVEDFLGPRLSHWLKIIGEAQKLVGKVFGLYDFASQNGCQFLEEWAEIYDPNRSNGEFCESACVCYFHMLQQGVAIFSTAFEEWGALVTVYSPVYCLNICGLLHDDGLVSERRLQAATDFLLDGRQFLQGIGFCTGGEPCE